MGDKACALAVRDSRGTSTFFTGFLVLSVELTAVRQKEYALAMGDLFGSSVTNVTLVLGVASVLNPVSIDVFPLMALLPFLFAGILVSWYSFSRNGQIGRRTGIVLLCLYLAFILEEFGLISIFG